MAFKFLNLDSTYRNRVQYPLASDFLIPYTNLQPGNNFFNSKDPVSLAYPYASGVTQAGSTTTDIVLDPTASSIDNFYVNSYLEISGFTTVIGSYVASTKTATVNFAFPVAPIAGSSYLIRKQPPLAIGTVQAGSTDTQIVFPSTFSTNFGTYSNSLFILNGVNTGKYIVQYNGVTKTATLSSPLSSVPVVGTPFELDSFSYDNAQALNYTGSRTLNNAVCYIIHLTQLSVPNLILNIGNGGRIWNYPYLLVHFYNEPKHTEGTMYGNNPNINNATIRVSIPSSFAGDTQSPFFVFVDSSFYAPQQIKFSYVDNIRFRICLPTGEPLSFTTPDTYTPLPPNPAVQITSYFGLKMDIQTY